MLTHNLGSKLIKILLHQEAQLATILRDSLQAMYAPFQGSFLTSTQSWLSLAYLDKNYSLVANRKVCLFLLFILATLTSGFAAESYFLPSSKRQKTIETPSCEADFVETEGASEAEGSFDGPSSQDTASQASSVESLLSQTWPRPPLQVSRISHWPLSSQTPRHRHGDDGDQDDDIEDAAAERMMLSDDDADDDEIAGTGSQTKTPLLDSKPIAVTGMHVGTTFSQRSSEEHSSLLSSAASDSMMGDSFQKESELADNSPLTNQERVDLQVLVGGQKSLAKD